MPGVVADGVVAVPMPCSRWRADKTTSVRGARSAWCAAGGKRGLRGEAQNLCDETPGLFLLGLALAEAERVEEVERREVGNRACT